MITKKVPNWLTLITLAIGFIMATLDASIMNVAVATVQKELSLSSTSGTWIIDSYLLSFASLLLLGGVLANKFGSKTIYLVGMFLFLIGSISGGFSGSGAWLIGSRFFQGIGAAFFMPSSLSLLVLSFEDKTERAKMLGIWSAVVSISSGVGPFVGGALISGLGWRSIFFINVPLGIIGLVLAYRFAINPKSDRSLKLTVLPNLLSMIMLASFAYTLIEGGTYGIAYFPVIISFILFLITLFLFTSYERKAKLPMIPLGLIKIRAFVFSNFTAVLLNSSMMGGLFIFGLYLQSSNHSTAVVRAILSAQPMIKRPTRTATSVQALAHSRQALLVSHQARLMTGIMLLQVLYQQLRRILRRIVFRALSATIRMPLIRRTVTMLPITSRHQAVPTLSMRQLTATVQAIPTQAMRLVSISPLLTATAQQFTTTIILL